MHARTRKQSSSGFSLIELVIVVVIIGIIGAIAIPRMSRGAAGASDSALVANLSVLRNAIDLYAAEHNGDFPTSHETIGAQLTERTDTAGNPTGTADAGPFIYGPYLRSVPPLPVGALKGETGFTNSVGTAGAGWVYTAATGEVVSNTADSEEDEAAVPYNEY